MLTSCSGKEKKKRQRRNDKKEQIRLNMNIEGRFSSFNPSTLETLNWKKTTMRKNVPVWKQRVFLFIYSSWSCVFTATRRLTAACARRHRRRGNSSSAGIWRRIKARGDPLQVFNWISRRISGTSLKCMWASPNDALIFALQRRARALSLSRSPVCVRACVRSVFACMCFPLPPPLPPSLPHQLAEAAD